MKTQTLAKPLRNRIEAPAAKACCGLAHGLPFQHRKWFKVGNMMRPYYKDAQGRKREVLECGRCFRTLEARGLRPGNIRWCEPNSPYCKECSDEFADRLEAAKVEHADENEAWVQGFLFRPKGDR